MLLLVIFALRCANCLRHYPRTQRTVKAFRGLNEYYSRVTKSFKVNRPNVLTVETVRKTERLEYCTFN